MKTLSSVTVLVTALTFQRPADLTALIPALVAQALDATATIEIAIIDNDPHGGAARITADAAVGSAIPIRYLHVPEPGIAAARNAALTGAGEFDLLVFIDDDERPVERWLYRLIDTYLMHRSTAVVGPVISEFAAAPDPWIDAGGYFSRRRMPTGSAVELAATNNLLLDMRRVRELGLRFDERFGLTGGSDTLFARQLHARGGTMIWCDDAVVIDKVPGDRLTRDWVVRRAFRSGNTWMRTSLELAPTPARRLTTRVRLSALGLARVFVGSLRVTLGIASGRLTHRAKGVRTVARGAGLLAGTFGAVYAEYRR